MGLRAVDNPQAFPMTRGFIHFPKKVDSDEHLWERWMEDDVLLTSKKDQPYRITETATDHHAG